MEATMNFTGLKNQLSKKTLSTLVFAIFALLIIPSAFAHVQTFTATPFNGVAPLEVVLACGTNYTVGPMEVLFRFDDGESQTVMIDGPDTVAVTHTYEAGYYNPACFITSPNGFFQGKSAIVDVLPPKCSDGKDNDGDGLIDLADSGCTDALDNDEFNDRTPKIEFTADKTSGEAILSVRFICKITDGDGIIESEIDFGDGDFAPKRGYAPLTHNVGNNYLYPGVYGATCSATDADGDTASKSIAITVTKPNLKPKAILSISPTTGLSPLTSSISCSGSGGDGALSYELLFGDGTSKTSTSAIQESHTYTTGTYSVTCRVTDADGDKNEVSKLVSVSLPQCSDGKDNDGDGLIDLLDPGCVNALDNDEFNQIVVDTQTAVSASASPSSGLAPLSTQITCLVTNGDGPLNVNIAYGDGTSEQKTLPSTGSTKTTHIYSSAGIYSASCTVTDKDGDVDSDVTMISVSSPQCSDGLDNDGDGLVDLQDPGCSSPQDNSEGDATTACQDGIDNDNDGLIDLADPGCISKTDDDEYNNLVPTATLSISPKVGVSELTASITCSATGGDGVVKRELNFGDGTSTSQNTDIQTTRTYGVGTFTVTCRAVDANGDINAKTDVITISAPTQCSDGLDNDGDGLVDLQDPGCSNPNDNDESDKTSQCQDGIDNDDDGATDYPFDFSCSSPSDNDETNPKAACQDGLDNDNDGLVDLQDPGCSSKQDNDEYNVIVIDNPVSISFSATPSSGTELLQTALKCVVTSGDGPMQVTINSGDGISTSSVIQGPDTVIVPHTYVAGNYVPSCTVVDADFDTQTKTASVSVSPAVCNDGLDNDGDGLVDLQDPGCINKYDGSESDGTSACQDGIDNDNDGAIDYPFDVSCSSPQDDDELFPIPACQDGIDNDGDGLIDLADPGCSSKQDTSELNNFDVSVTLSASTMNAVAPATIVLTCSVDAKDAPSTVNFNFGDGTSATEVIFASTSVTKTHVYASSGNYLASCSATDANGDSDVDNKLISISSPQCSDGLDNDGDGLVDLQDPGCSSPNDNDESDKTSQCQDGLDNDNDGLIDLADPACSSPQDDDESDDPKISFGGLPPANAKVGRLYYFDLNPSALNPTFTKVIGPAGLNVDTNGVITWVPQKADVGAHRVIIKVTSGSLQTDIVWTIQVAEDAPEREELQISQIRFLGGEITHPGNELGVSIALNNDGQDIDNAEISFTVADLGIRRTVGPFDMDGESESELVYLDIPTYAQQGEYVLRVTISADGKTLRTTHRYFTIK